MPLFSVVISFNNKKRAFAETLFYYPWALASVRLSFCHFLSEIVFNLCK